MCFPTTSAHSSLGSSSRHRGRRIKGDELDALANAKLVIHEICDQADLPVDFAENRRPRPSEWHLIDDAAIPPLLASA
jgi:hypothetical protein